VTNVNERLNLEQQFYNSLLSKLEYMPDPGSSYTSQIQKEVIKKNKELAVVETMKLIVNSI